MCSRALLLLGLLVAILLLISSEVVARDLAQTSTEKQNAKASTGTSGVDKTKHDDNGRYEPQCIFPIYPPPPPPSSPCGCGGVPSGGFVPPGASGPSSIPPSSTPPSSTPPSSTPPSSTPPSSSPPGIG